MVKRRYSRLEMWAWVGVIAASPVFYGFECDLSSEANPRSSLDAAIALNRNTSATDASTHSWTNLHERRKTAELVEYWGSLLFHLLSAYADKSGKVPVRAPSLPCPAIQFAAASNMAALGVNDTGSIVLTGVLYRQADGGFTLQGFSVPAGSAQAVGTSIVTEAQAQSSFAACHGIALGSPKPHAALLGDVPGSMSRDSVVANLGGASPYASIKATGANQLTVVLDTQATFGKTSAKFTLVSPVGLVAADFNGDGKRDVAVLNDRGPNSAPGFVSLLLGNGDGTLKAPVNYAVGRSAAAMTWFDFNKDGRADLAVVNHEDNSVTVLIGRADGTLNPGVTYALPGRGSFGAKVIVAGDFDGDGNGDAIAYNGLGLTLLRGNGDGTFQAVAQKAGYQPTYQPIYAATGDFNNDGKLDLSFQNIDGTASILLNGGDGSFPTENRYQAGTPWSAGVNQKGMFAMDFDDDGKLDLVLATGHPDALYPTPQFTTVLFGNGDGTVRGGAPAYGTDFGPKAMAMADLNGDGRRDLAIATQSTASRSGLWILPGKSGGGFLPATELARPANVGYPEWVAAGDVNGDGRADLISLVTAFNLPGFVYTWQGNGDGTFQLPVSHAGGTYPKSVAAGDVNGDGRADVIVMYGQSKQLVPGTPASVLLMTAKSGGGLNPGIAVATGVNTSQVALGDVNGDGKPDLIAANSGNALGYTGNPTAAGTVSVSLGNGDDTFQAPVQYNVARTPISVAAGDVNGDGKADLVVGTVTDTDAKIAVLIGNGSGAFGAPTLFDTYSWPSHVVPADFDGDSKLDLAIVHWSGDSPLSFMKGNGNGTFAAETMLLAGDVPVGAIAADFSGDGRLDLAVVNQAYGGSGTAAVFTNISAFASACSYSLGNPPAPFAATAGSGSFTVTAGSGCDWTAASGSPDWIKIDSGGLGPGNGTVKFTVAANSGGPRSGNINVGGQTLAITQSSGAVAGVPKAVSAEPGAGSTASQTLTFTFSDTGGYQNLSVVNVLINNFINGIGACYVAIVPADSAVYLVDDGGNAGGPYQGMTLPGSDKVQNSQCSITGTGSSIIGSGNTLTVTLAVTFKAAFAGNKVIYLAAREATGANSDWQALGTWSAPGSNPTGPSVGGVTPARSSGSGSQAFAFTFNDTNGVQDLGVLNVLINHALTGVQSCYLAYVRSANVVYLVNDGVLSAGLTLNGSGSINNGQCTVNGAGSSASGAGNTLTLTLNLTFPASFAGNRIVYAAARSNGDVLNSGWQAVGSRTVQ